MRTAVASLPLERVAHPEDLGLDLPLPPASMSRAYFIGRLLTFGIPNQRRDVLLDVDDKVIQTLAGAPLVTNKRLTDHSDEDGTRVRVGSIVKAVKRPEAVYVLAAVDRDELSKLGVDANTLASLSLSMECKFNPEETRYEVDGQILDREAAVKAGIAANDPSQDDPRRYVARHLHPLEYPAAALLHRGHQADLHAHVLQAVASKKLQRNIFDFTEGGKNGVAELRRLISELRAEARASRDEKAEVERRLASLARWKTLSTDEAEHIRQIAMATIGDELSWLSFANQFYAAALSEARAANVKVPPTLRTGFRTSRNIFDFTTD